MENFNIHFITWNVGTKFPSASDDLKSLLGLSVKTNTYVEVPDLYVLGLQEVKSQPQNILWDTLFEDPWTQKVKEVLAPFGFVKILTYRLQGLVTSLYLKRTHLINLRDIETLNTRRGLGGIWGNKGAVSVRLGIHGCSLCFVNCHLTAHDNFLQERIEDYRSILEGQIFSYPETSNILFHDYVFWGGDLNFRLGGNKSSEEIVEMVSNKQYKALLQEDELNQVRKSGHAFSELKEMEINFPPTYKFLTGFDNYDLKRRPGYTDRILYHVNSNVYDNVKLNVEEKGYNMHLNYRASDHKPVTGNFQIKVFRPTIQTLIEFQDIPVWKLGENNKVFYKVTTSMHISPEDWIAIYKADFTSLDDYIAYVYSGVPQNNEIEEFEDPHNEGADTPEEYSVIFSDNSITLPGSYILIYFSHPSKSIYGLSPPFEAIQAIN